MAPGWHGPGRYAPGWYAPFPHGAIRAPSDRRTIANAYRAIRDEQRRDEARYFNEQDMNRRKERLLSSHKEAVAAGLARLKSADFAQAVVALTLASELDQGDPACRVHLAQARMALGQHDEAGRILRRALQLQPKLIYMDLHLDDYFDTPERFDGLIESLRGALTPPPRDSAPRSSAARDSATAGESAPPPAARRALSRRAASLRPDAYFLLGYCEFQRGRFAEAAQAFRRVEALWPKDELTRRYLDIIAPR